MIHHAVAHVIAELNSYLQIRAPGDPARVVAGSVLNQDGTLNPTVENKVAVTLVNIEPDRVYRDVELYRRQEDGTSERVRPELRVNFYLTFIANLNQYDEALKVVSNIVGYFHQNATFAYAEIPDLSDREGRFTFELYPMSFEKLNHLWAALGAKYTPSVLYRVGLVDLSDTTVEGLVPPVLEVDAEGHSI